VVRRKKASDKSVRRGERKVTTVSPQALWYRQRVNDPGFRETRNAAARSARASTAPEERRANGIKKNAAQRAAYAALSPGERSARAQRSTEASRLRLAALTPAEQEKRRLKKNADQNARRAALPLDERRAIAKRPEAVRLRVNAAQNAKRAVMSPAERKAKDAAGQAGRSKASLIKKNGYEREKYRRRVAFVNSLKKDPCLDCGKRYAPYVMDFDHRPGTTKVSAVGNMFGVSIERVLEEISKCDLVCSNCHRERTHLRRGPSATSKNARQRALIASHKNAPCADCCVTYPPYVMDLDHRPGVTKVAAVGALLGRCAPPSRISEEIAKCDAVCSNCHRERTYQRRKQT